MSRYRRAFDGRTYFFTVIAYRRRPILCDLMIRAALRDAIRAVRITRPFTIDAWVLLPDHLHCIWTLPEHDTNFSQRWSQIKHHVSRACGDAYPMRQSVSGVKRGEASIWQRRFWEHRIRDDRDMERHMDYVHFNPVKHGHVEQAIAWPYSTLRRHVDAGWYPEDWAGRPELDTIDLE